MVLLFLLDLDHVDSTEEADVNQFERCLGRPYNPRRLQHKEIFNLQPREKNRADSVFESFSSVSDFFTHVFNISFVQTCRIGSQPHDYPCLQLR